MADKSEIIDEIEALAVHCRPPIMEPSARVSWLRDWCDDLASFPIEAVRGAVRKWRHSGATKFPTAGQFLPMIRESLPAEGPRVDVWRPLSDAEYTNLSLRDKMRHHQILAHAAGRKAGPMWKQVQGNRPTPGHIAAEDMPDTWRRWKQVEANHNAEAKRLREILNRSAMPHDGEAA